MELLIVAALAGLFFFSRSSTSSTSGTSPATGESALTSYQVQQYLNALRSLGYTASSTLQLDGTSRAAIRQFQADHQLAQTSQLDAATQSELNAIWQQETGSTIPMHP